MNSNTAAALRSPACASSVSARTTFAPILAPASFSRGCAPGATRSSSSTSRSGSTPPNGSRCCAGRGSRTGWCCGSLASWSRLARRRLADRSRYDAVLVGYLGHFDVLLARLLYPRRRLVLDQLIFAADTARDRGVSGGRSCGCWPHSIGWPCGRQRGCARYRRASELLPQGPAAKAVLVPVGARQPWFDGRRSGVPRLTRASCGSSSSGCSRRCRERRHRGVAGAAGRSRRSRGDHDRERDRTWTPTRLGRAPATAR